ncbi:hypothetical protein H0H93_002661 [Arthromyces matolae]|nr:hypothetical protein H0H93_002661 [Arthromyces matolae]
MWNEVGGGSEEKTKDDDSTSGKKDSNGNGNGNGSGENGSGETNTLSGDVEDAERGEGNRNLGGEAETESQNSTGIIEDHRFELRDIDIRFPEGELTLITGPTASGKTALLVRIPPFPRPSHSIYGSSLTPLQMALLGEMTLLPTTPPGKLHLSKSPHLHDTHGNSLSLSYASQSPWLLHQSIRDNILFSSPYDPTRYASVLSACALNPDLEVLEDGDMTEIGARGVSLSGGQKARVALARAVYGRSRWVVLDDPLSAVDSGTAGWIVERLLGDREGLLKGRTVILVTHHVDLVLPCAHYLVRMLDGRIDTQGLVKDLRAQGVLEALTHHDSAVSPAAEADIDKPDDDDDDVEELVDTPEEREEEQGQGEDDAEMEDGGEAGTPKKKKKGKKPRKLIKDEHREVGGVKWRIYKSYLKASSYWIWVFLAFLVLLSQLLGVGEKVWIMIWGEAYKESPTSLYAFTSFTTKSHHELQIDVNGYHPSHLQINDVLANTFSSVNLPSVQDTLFTSSNANSNANGTTNKGRFGIDWPSALEHPLFYIGVYAAIGLLNVLIGVASMIAQYTERRLGSMIRRPKDIETIDTSLAGSLQAVNTSLANFFASIILVAAVFPWFLIPAIFLGFAYRELSIGYLNTGRDLRRMESNSRSPIFSDFGELLEGIVTVRAFSAERRFLDGLHTKIDLTTKFIGLVGSGLVRSLLSFGVPLLTFWVIEALELDLNLDLPQEPPAIIESNRPPAYWPSSTNNESLIAVEDLVIKYAPDLPAVLQNVSFSLKAGERVGLLGRTGSTDDDDDAGSGKSTLAMSILRFVDPTSGRILIDGIDISKIGIHDLRSRLDATLFSGTLRENLDPFNEHTDAECIDVLQRCHMINSPSGSRSVSHAPSPSTSRPASIHGTEQEDTAESISTTTTDVEAKTTVTLDTQVSAGGTNFSQGQRQLIAMARALLRRSSIIVLDEATSSIDFATDAKIQTTIREEFNSSLLLTIAHRLRTVIDYDRLIVLDKGQVAEFDTPWKLIQKENGIFRNGDEFVEEPVRACENSPSNITARLPDEVLDQIFLWNLSMQRDDFCHPWALVAAIQGSSSRPDLVSRNGGGESEMAGSRCQRLPYSGIVHDYNSYSFGLIIFFLQATPNLEELSVSLCCPFPEDDLTFEAAVTLPRLKEFAIVPVQSQQCDILLSCITHPATTHVKLSFDFVFQEFDIVSGDVLLDDVASVMTNRTVASLTIQTMSPSKGVSLLVHGHEKVMDGKPKPQNIELTLNAVDSRRDDQHLLELLFDALPLYRLEILTISPEPLLDHIFMCKELATLPFLHTITITRRPWAIEHLIMALVPLPDSRLLFFDLLLAWFDKRGPSVIEPENVYDVRDKLLEGKQARSRI